MFDAIGRKGRVKALSPYRWAISSFIGFGMLGVLWVMTDVIQHMPEAQAKEDDEPTEVKFVTVKPPPPPPPPPAPVPQQTTRPRRNTITKKVVQKEIKEPTPTPIPKKDEPTPPPEPEMAADSGGVPGGVPGGVLGGVLGGVVGGTGSAPQDIQEVNVSDVKLLNMGDVQRAFKAGIPSLARRASLSAEGLVEISAAPDGHVMDVMWVSGNELFRDAIMSAARTCRFEPRPISFRVRVPFKFTIK